MRLKKKRHIETLKFKLTMFDDGSSRLTTDKSINKLNSRVWEAVAHHFTMDIKSKLDDIINGKTVY